MHFLLDSPFTRTAQRGMHERLVFQVSQLEDRFQIGDVRIQTNYNSSVIYNVSNRGTSYSSRQAEICEQRGKTIRKQKISCHIFLPEFPFSSQPHVHAFRAINLIGLKTYAVQNLDIFFTN